MALVLIGFMGAGKSSAARLLALRLGVESCDADEEIERSLGEPIPSFWEREGEEAFRAREREVVLGLLNSRAPAVLALGGGAVTDPQIRERLRDHIPIYLEVDADEAWARVGASDRPLAKDREAFAALLAQRRPLYESVAGLRMLWARTASGGYPVFVGAGASSVAGELWCGGERCFAIGDESALAHHRERLRAALADKVELAAELAVPAGESSKTMAQAEALLRELARAGMRRDDTLVALGGGVVGDLAGFCAAIYQRGVSVVQVPTTLVAQVDAAYGGKTGVDLPEAKNYVGVFHQPLEVIADPDLLRTLPAEELSAGFAEVIKTALIAGGSLWQMLDELAPVARLHDEDMRGLGRAIERCARTKLAIVAADEYDKGLRASLNLGHTFAHALESATGYAAYRHGEAVAIGLLVALRLSERELGLSPEVRERVISQCERHGLPTSFEGPPAQALLEHVARDKKVSAGGRRNLVLLRAPGDVALRCEVNDDALIAAIEEVRRS
jgi:shikimate kinase/3-dehydroquinate synthase